MMGATNAAVARSSIASRSSGETWAWRSTSAEPTAPAAHCTRVRTARLAMEEVEEVGGGRARAPGAAEASARSVVAGRASRSKDCTPEDCMLEPRMPLPPPDAGFATAAAAPLPPALGGRRSAAARRSACMATPAVARPLSTTRSTVTAPGAATAGVCSRPAMGRPPKLSSTDASTVMRASRASSHPTGPCRRKPAAAVSGRARPLPAGRPKLGSRNDGQRSRGRG
mmetsp:Transcript_8043/g.26513  ORF Transcript_8043/g.26513 Transcript_8043/m.26513 type:complete len:226 (+) Transcript_8043:1825-2502(+)